MLSPSINQGLLLKRLTLALIGESNPTPPCISELLQNTLEGNKSAALQGNGHQSASQGPLTLPSSLFPGPHS